MNRYSKHVPKIWLTPIWRGPWRATNLLKAYTPGAMCRRALAQQHEASKEN